MKMIKVIALAAMALDGYDAQYIKEAAIQACKYDIDKFYEDAYTFFDD